MVLEGKLAAFSPEFISINQKKPSPLFAKATKWKGPGWYSMPQSSMQDKRLDSSFTLPVSVEAGIPEKRLYWQDENRCCCSGCPGCCCCDWHNGRWRVCCSTNRHEEPGWSRSDRLPFILIAGRRPAFQ